MSDNDFQQEFMIPAGEARVENLAVIHALRANADGMKRLGEQQDRMSSKIDTVHDCVHDIDKRLAIIEGNSLSSTVKDIDDRVSKLEEHEQRRQGAIGLWEWGNKSWPAVLAFVGLVVYVVVEQLNIL